MSIASVTTMSWFPARQADGAGVDGGHAGVGIGAVSDQITKAPDLVNTGFLDLVEHRGERGKIGVNVRDDGDSHPLTL